MRVSEPQASGAVGGGVGPIGTGKESAGRRGTTPEETKKSEAKNKTRMLETDSLSFPTLLRQGFGGQAPG